MTVSPINALLSLLINPDVAYLLFVLGLLGLVGELVASGTMVPGTVGAIALILSLVGLGQLPTNWGGAALIVAAVLMFLFDLKIPGHGLSVGGILVFLLGSLLLFTPPWVVLGGASTAARLNLWVVLWTTIGVAGFFVLGVAAGLRSLHLPVAVGRSTLIGKTGVVRRELNPEGIVHVEGEEWSAQAVNRATVPEGKRVRVVGMAGLTLQVEPVAEDAEADTLLENLLQSH